MMNAAGARHCSRPTGPWLDAMVLLLLTVEFLSVFPGAIVSGTSRGSSHRVRTAQPAMTEEAITRLSRVFRIDKVPVRDTLSQHRTPMEYMTNLYGTLAYQNGITKQDTPFNSDVVRGLPDRGECGVIGIA